jgi:hypothetical protein
MLIGIGVVLFTLIPFAATDVPWAASLVGWGVGGVLGLLGGYLRNRCEIRLSSHELWFRYFPLPRRGLREPTANILGFEAAHPALRMLTLDRRSVDIQLGSLTDAETKFVAARLNSELETLLDHRTYRE